MITVPVMKELNKLSSLQIPSWEITLFTVFNFLSEILRMMMMMVEAEIRDFFKIFFEETPRDTTTEL